LQEANVSRIKIGNDTWIGANPVDMADNGDHSFKGVRSVLIHTVKSNPLYLGDTVKDKYSKELI